MLARAGGRTRHAGTSPGTLRASRVALGLGLLAAWASSPGRCRTACSIPDGSSSIRLTRPDGHSSGSCRPGGASRSALTSHARRPCRRCCATPSSPPRTGASSTSGRRPAGHRPRCSGNLRAGRVVSGASTLTQQLARMLVPRRRTAGRKGPGGAVGAPALGAPPAGARSSGPTSTGCRWGTTWSASRRPAQALLRPSRRQRSRVGQASLAGGHRPVAGAGGPLGGPRLRCAIGSARCSAGCSAPAGSTPSWRGWRARRGRWTSCTPSRPFGAPHLVVRPRPRLDALGLGQRGVGRHHPRPGAPAGRGAVGALGAGRGPAPRPGGGAGRRQRLGRGPGLRRLGRLPRRRSTRARTTGSVPAGSRAAR